MAVYSEVYELLGKGGKRLSLDIRPLRLWAEKHAEKVTIPVDVAYIERLLKRGAVTQDRVMAKLAEGNPKPALLCRDINEDGDEIVDGNHTYVAMGMAWRAAVRLGQIASDVPWSVRAFEIQPKDWQRFIITPPQRRR